MSTTQGKPVASQSSPFVPLYGVYVASVAISLVGNLAIRIAQRGGWLPAWGQVLVATASALPLVIGAALFWRLLRRDLDEMLQRLVLEGLAFALTLYVPLSALYVNLKTARALPFRVDPPEMLLTPAMLVVLGVAIAWRRYR